MIAVEATVAAGTAMATAENEGGERMREVEREKHEEKVKEKEREKKRKRESTSALRSTGRHNANYLQGADVLMAITKRRWVKLW